jgi:hypothetical protein
MSKKASLSSYIPSSLDGTTEVIEPLRSAEQNKLVDCEQTIRRGIKAFFEVGKALAIIKTERLYRCEYQTFDQYCEEKWDFSRIRAYQLINATACMEMLTNVNIPIPQKEAQVRPLLNIPENEIAETWRMFVEEKGERPFTARDVRDFVDRKLGKAVGPVASRSSGKVSQRNESLSMTFELSTLVKEIARKTDRYGSDDELRTLVVKLKDCVDRIQDRCLRQ